MQQGNPHLITRFPGPVSIKGYHRFQPNPQKLITELVGKDYIALTQMPGYASEAGWMNEAERQSFIEKNRLRFMRDYQKRAVQSIQDVVAEGKSRFLLEVATGTGKTLTAAAVIKLFLRTGNARRVLFLVDRLELEDQANKAFILLLKNDYTSVIYKERRDDWRKAEIVVTTVQSLLFNDKYRRLVGARTQAPDRQPLLRAQRAFHRQGQVGGGAARRRPASTDFPDPRSVRLRIPRS